MSPKDNEILQGQAEELIQKSLTRETIFDYNNISLCGSFVMDGPSIDHRTPNTAPKFSSNPTEAEAAATRCFFCNFSVDITETTIVIAVRSHMVYCQ